MKKRAVLFLTFLTLMIMFLSLLSISEIIFANGDEKIIYLDPGHGGFDGGAVSKDQRYYEKNLTLSVAIKLSKFLKETGLKVKMTRDIDQALSQNKTEDIHRRVKLINQMNNSLYVSIHANSYPNANIKGAQTFYHPQKTENQILATTIMDFLKIIDPYNNRVSKSLTGKYLLDKIQIPGCLVEIGFLTNLEELQKMITEDYQEKIAYAIYLGILQYLEITGE